MVGNGGELTELDWIGLVKVDHNLLDRAFLKYFNFRQTFENDKRK